MTVLIHLNLFDQNGKLNNFSDDHTAKLLVGVAPCGTIVFMSSAYPGNTSDKQLTIDSGVLDNLEAGDGVMADKGFLIDDLLVDG